MKSIIIMLICNGKQISPNNDELCDQKHIYEWSTVYFLQHTMADEAGSKPTLENTEADVATIEDDAEAEVSTLKIYLLTYIY